MMHPMSIARRWHIAVYILTAACVCLALSGTCLRVQAQTRTTLSGRFTLQGCVNPAQSLTFIFHPTTGAAAFSQTATLNSDGSFSLSNIPVGTYDLAIKGSKWLQKVLPATVITAGNGSSISATLLAGDINGDNQISLADYALLRAALGSKPGDANWNANADLNCDGQVTAADYVLLRNNFGLKGDLLPVHVIPGSVAAKGSIRATDGVSSVNFNILVQFTNSKINGSFTVYSYGPGLPAFGFSSNDITSVQFNPDNTSAVVYGIASLNGQPVQVQFNLSKSGGPYGSMSLQLSGADTFLTQSYPTTIPLYYGTISLRPAYYY